MDFDRLQLTLLIIFAFVLTARYIFSLAGGIKPVLIFKKEKGRKERFVEILPVAGVGLAALLILRGIFTPAVCEPFSAGLDMPVYLRTMGFVLSLLSFYLLAAGYWSLGESWRVGTGDEASGELVTTGIFSYTRNPVYLFFIFFLCGLFLISGEYLQLIIFLLVAVSLHLQVQQEEKALSRRFGNRYDEYTEKVPRYLFRIRPNGAPRHD